MDIYVYASGEAFWQPLVGHADYIIVNHRTPVAEFIQAFGYDAGVQAFNAAARLWSEVQ